MFAKFSPDLLVYAAIFIVTLIGFIKCIFPVLRTTRGLNGAIRKLEESTGAEATAIWHDENFVGRVLRPTWQKFLMTEDEMEKRGLACPVEDYINTRTVTKIPGNASLSELIPSLLTSLGILGTFIGLTRGLTGLDMTDANTLMNGIPILLDGMKAAFGTSVAGISCSLIFSMLNRALQGNSYRAIDSFIEVFTAKSGHRALDTDYQMVLQSNDRNKMLGCVTSGLEETVTSTVRSMMEETVDPLADAMEKHVKSAKAIETASEDAVRIQEMTGEICDKYQAILDHLTSAQNAVNTTAVQLNGSLKTFSESMMAMNGMINQKMAASEVEQINTAEELAEIKELLARLVQQTEKMPMASAGKQEKARKGNR